jgi:hypothetical protein
MYSNALSSGQEEIKVLTMTDGLEKVRFVSGLKDFYTHNGVRKENKVTSCGRRTG